MYKLCGVNTNKDTTYIRRQAEPDLIDMDLDETEPSSTKDQWWRIIYAATEEKPVKVTVRLISALIFFTLKVILTNLCIQKVSLEEVLDAAMAESKHLLLIYANEKAMAEAIKPLPDSLEVSLFAVICYLY
jgi:hypothetical protein